MYKQQTLWGESELKFQRVWAMPCGNTFSIKPIKQMIEYDVARLGKDAVIVDPFANSSTFGTITNDLNPEFNTTYHLDALTFLSQLETESADMVLYDPPYSITQASELYQDFGKEKLDISVANMAYWSNCKDEVARILKPNGVCISFGWNTNGLGENRGFVRTDILIVSHGGSRNDTLCTREEKRLVYGQKPIN